MQSVLDIRPLSPILSHVEAVMESAAMAFSGHSQIPDATWGQIVRGHINNGGPLTKFPPKETIRAIAALLADRWEADRDDEWRIIAAITRAFEKAS